MWNRREFIKKSALAGMGLSLFSESVWASTNKKALVILHTNDIHSHIDPFPKNDKKYPNQGGLSRIASLVKEVKKNNKRVILLDSGDVFQGTPYFNVFKGKVEFELMSKMGYAASTLGNHDFDNGVIGLANMLPHASFPFINCNYVIENLHLKGKVKSSMVKDVEGVKVGVLGVGIDFDGLVLPSLCEGIKYTDPIIAANKEAKMLKEELNCDVVICLSHLGYSYASDKVSDVVLAKKSKNIDVILGGHTHTFLEKPVKYKNLAGKEVVVNQAGWAGLSLGRVDLKV